MVFTSGLVRLDLILKEQYLAGRWNPPSLQNLNCHHKAVYINLTGKQKAIPKSDKSKQ